MVNLKDKVLQGTYIYLAILGMQIEGKDFANKICKLDIS